MQASQPGRHQVGENFPDGKPRGPQGESVSKMGLEHSCPLFMPMEYTSSPLCGQVSYWVPSKGAGQSVGGTLWLIRSTLTPHSHPTIFICQPLHPLQFLAGETGCKHPPCSRLRNLTRLLGYEVVVYFG